MYRSLARSIPCTYRATCDTNCVPLSDCMRATSYWYMMVYVSRGVAVCCCLGWRGCVCFDTSAEHINNNNQQYVTIYLRVLGTSQRRPKPISCPVHSEMAEIRWAYALSVYHGILTSLMSVSSYDPPFHASSVPTHKQLRCKSVNVTFSPNQVYRFILVAVHHLKP